MKEMPQSARTSVSRRGARDTVRGRTMARVESVLAAVPRPVLALVAIGLWAVFQVVNGIGAFAVTEETAGGVAYMAHIGGFAAGLVAGLFFRAIFREPRRPRNAPASAWG